MECISKRQLVRNQNFEQWAGILYLKLKHIGIKYFWTTNRIEDGNIVVQYCPTTQMIADFMSKPVQGQLFKTFRNVLMGWAHISSVFKGYIHPKDRIEDSMKTSLTQDNDVTELKRMKRKLARAKVEEQDREISLNRKNPISDNVKLLLLHQVQVLHSSYNTPSKWYHAKIEEFQW